MAVMAAHEPVPEPVPAQDDALLEEAFLALETPEGFRAELIEGEIVVTPPPDGDHEDIISTLLRQVFALSGTAMDASGNKGLLVPRGGRCPKNHVIPDATFAARESRLFRGTPSWMTPEGIAMVAEVTSSKPDRDRTDKRHCYARAGIPLYLLVDRESETVTLHGEPSGSDYAEVHAVPFGKRLPLPKPFGFGLDTSPLR